MKNKIFITICLITAFGFFACETSEDISFGMDHEVPSYTVLTDSLTVPAGQAVEIKVDVWDNAGLKKVVFSYGNWSLRESVSLDEAGNPASYRYETTITIPDDAEKEWEEDVVLNTGNSIKITQRYHKLNLEATDINMNVRNIPIYIKVE